MKNRWLIALSAVGIHISIGSVYAWSVFNLPLENAFGWTKGDVAITFSLAIFFLGMSAAVMGRFVERRGPRTSGTVAAALWGTGLLVASLGVKLGMIQVLWLGYGILGGMGLGIGYITPVSTLVKWFPDRRGLATGLAIMGFGFGAAIGGPVFNYIMSRVAAGQLGLSESTYSHGVANYNAAKTILKGMHLHDSSTAAIELPEFLSMVRDGRSEKVLASLPEKQARDAAGTLAELQSGQADPVLAPFWASAGTPPFRSAIAAGISAAFLLAGIAYLVIMLAAARYIERPPPGWMPERMKADVDAGKRKVIPDLTQLTANAAVRRAPFYGLWVMMFINISCGIGIIYTASPLAQESIGLTPAQAAGVVGLMSIFNGLGRLGWASLSDYLGRPGTYTAFFIIQVVAFWVLPDITSVILFQTRALPDPDLLRRRVCHSPGVYRRSVRHQGAGRHPWLRLERLGSGRRHRPAAGGPPVSGHGLLRSRPARVLGGVRGGARREHHDDHPRHQCAQSDDDRDDLLVRRRGLYTDPDHVAHRRGQSPRSIRSSIASRPAIRHWCRTTRIGERPPSSAGTTTPTTRPSPTCRASSTGRSSSETRNDRRRRLDLRPLSRQSAVAAKQPPRFELPLLGSNQDSPDPESCRPRQTFPDNLLGYGHFLSTGACLPAVACPLVPGETTAKLQHPRR